MASASGGCGNWHRALAAVLVYTVPTVHTRERAVATPARPRPRGVSVRYFAQFNAATWTVLNLLVKRITNEMERPRSILNDAFYFYKAMQFLAVSCQGSSFP